MERVFHRQLIRIISAIDPDENRLSDSVHPRLHSETLDVYGIVGYSTSVETVVRKRGRSAGN